MNVYDSDKMLEILSKSGYSSIDNPDDADLVILNTCHIREKAGEKVYSDLGRLRKLKTKKNLDGKKMFIVVAGCVAQAEGDEILKRAPFVDIVVGPQTYHKIPELLKKVDEFVKAEIDISFPPEEKFKLLPQINIKRNQLSSFLTVQEGCDKFCTFCVVPYTRGSEYSRSVEEIIAEAKILVSTGVREITLLGQNVNAYHGMANNGVEVGLDYVINKIAEIENLDRIRFTTSHPRDMQKNLIDLFGYQEKLMPLIHLPVQSGSDKILKDMNRGHNINDYKKIIHSLKEARPEISFSSDFIVGYPGETEKDFQSTLKLVEEVKFSQSFSFIYSPRPGTPASIKNNQIPEEIKKSRLHDLQKVLNNERSRFNSSFVGKKLNILLEKFTDTRDEFIGKSEYLQPVKIKCRESLIGQTFNVFVESVDSNCLNARLVN
ncbi:MAG: tRNA-2-methylthio-N(6)-dimethylallyladenosine synthase [Alphaproteobacteria bacterium MarineAlpha2_Bin1]|nr:MAG: tRNA-2-methylthio-N(6)-dimethylallyladenosine synthase [Alphaproteobacteria bacterium MarineAlpha2_Bin1]|tara:strand:+ start:353 stop:1651 length:1299 start_codon:yes stop_codon:yes gene_type:complete